MNGERELMEKVAFGIEVEAFLRGPIGSYLVDRLRAEAAEALEQLKAVNPRETERIIELQLTIRRGENIEGWLGGIIQEGWYAERQLKGEEL
jgi:hypothetical protein